MARAHLAQVFWPAATRERGLQSVRQTLTRLKGLLPVPVVEGEADLSLVRDRVRFDVDDLVIALDGGDASGALELWRGPLLKGFRRPEAWELEEWIDREGSALEKRLAAMVEAVGLDVLLNGDARDALALLGDAVRRLPSSSRLAALEVELLADAGQLDAAVGSLAALNPESPDELRMQAEDAVQRARARAQAAARGHDRSGAADEVDSAHTETPGPEPRGRASAPPSAGSPPSGDRNEPLPRASDRWVLRAAAAIVAVAIVLIALVPRSPEDETLALAESYGDLAMVFCSERATEGAFLQAFRMTLDGGNKHRIFSAEGCLVTPASDGTLIAVTREQPGEGPNRLYRFRRDPANPLAEWRREPIRATALTEPWVGLSNAGAAVEDVIFSAEDETGQRDLFRYLVQPDSLVQLTNGIGEESYPQIDPTDPDSPIVVEIAVPGTDMYGPSDDIQSNLWIINRDGTGLRQLTDTPGRKQAPMLFGDAVVYVRGTGVESEDGNMELILLDLSIGRVVQLTDNAYNDYGPSWSPDGKYICWQSEELGHYEMNLRVMEVATREARLLVDAPGRDGDCQWTPDSRAVVYRSWTSGDEEIMLVPARGGTPIRLTRMPGQDWPSRTFLTNDFLSGSGDGGTPAQDR